MCAEILVKGMDWTLRKASSYNPINTFHFYLVNKVLNVFIRHMFTRKI